MVEDYNEKSYSGVQDPFDGFFDSSVPSGNEVKEPILEAETDEVQSTFINLNEIEEFPNYTSTKEFYEGSNYGRGLGVRGNEKNLQYKEIIEVNPLKNIVENNVLFGIVQKQMRGIKVIDPKVPEAKATTPLLTAGEFLPNGSFVGIYRNTWKSREIPAGESAFYNAFNSQCHVIETDSRGNITILTINLAPYGEIKSPDRTSLNKNYQTKIPKISFSPNKYAEEIATFENNPSAAKQGMLHEIFDRILKENFEVGR